jgi:hypothetical protein
MGLSTAIFCPSFQYSIPPLFHFCLIPAFQFVCSAVDFFPPDGAETFIISSARIKGKESESKSRFK